MKKYFFLLITIISFSSCNIFHIDECISDCGSFTSDTVEVQNFSSLIVNDIFDIELIQDSLSFVLVEGYKKIIEKVDFSLNSDTLSVKNNFKCSFLKPEKKHIKLYLHIKNLNLIILNKPSKIRSFNNISGNSLQLILLNKFNDIELNVNYNSLNVGNENTGGGNTVLKGKCNYLFLDNRGMCSTDASKLETNFVVINNHSVADCHINSVKKINCKIYGLGNVYYSGNPDSINVKQNSQGKLIKVN